MNLPPKAQTEEVICQCYQVNEATIRAAIEKDNLTVIDQVTENCEAGGGCHSCHILLQLFIDEYQQKTLKMEDLVHDNAQKVKKRGILSRFFKQIKPNPS
jgi:NAD(P)H-nitrite reductase large subunit